MEEQLIAPCGINCYICPQYQTVKRNAEENLNPAQTALNFPANACSL